MPVARQPGRHAARRSSVPWSEVLPPSLRGRVALGVHHVTVVALLACVALGVTCWWLVRGSSEQVVSVASVVAQDPGETGPVAAPPAVDVPVADAGAVAGADESGEVTVDVAGRVRRPGIAVLPAGSRVADALQAAGGPRRGVDLTTLNLARPLVDGEQILVGVDPPPGSSVVPGSTGSVPPGGADPASGSGLVNLNTADQAQLETLPGVGPVTATAILTWRQSNGGFSSVAELIEVDGIGEKTLATLTPLVTV